MYLTMSHHNVNATSTAAKSSRRYMYLLSIMALSLSLRNHILVSGFVTSGCVTKRFHELLARKIERRDLSATSGRCRHVEKVNENHLLGHQARATSFGLNTPQRFKRVTTSQLMATDDDESADGSSDGGSFQSVLGIVGLASQPIVWVSLYFVKTTGGGLPAGPLGIIGLTEGIAYLAVLGLALVGIFTDTTSTNNAYATSTKLSLATLVVSLLVVINLTFDQGCIPNAKPILDYSAYVNVC